MSLKRKYPIRCPRCRHEQEAELYDAINIQTDPPLRDELLGRRLNVAVCGGCGAELPIEKALLYHDPRRGFVIYWQPPSEGAHVPDAAQLQRMQTALRETLPKDVPVPEIHVVRARVEMVERIFLLEAELDPRLIEYVKYQMYTRNLGRLDPAQKVLLFNAQDSTPENLCFVVQDQATRKLVSVLHYPRQTYETFRELMKEGAQAKELRRLFPGPVISARDLLVAEAPPASPAPSGKAE